MSGIAVHLAAFSIEKRECFVAEPDALGRTLAGARNAGVDFE
jgi:hypothetical protein